MDNTIIPRIISVLKRTNSGAIVLPANPSIDAVAAATTFYLAISKMNKNIALICDSAVSFDLMAVEKIKNEFLVAGDNLVVSFPYSDGAIDKVDYNIQGNSFNLIVTPRQGYPKLDPNQVKFSYSGGNLDYIITIDAPSLNSLGQIYVNNQAQFQGKELINIDRHLTNTSFGTINYLNKTTSSVSELILALIQQLEIEIDRDMATNLYAGISAATNNFTSYSVTADTFEKIASLLRMGAIKKNIKKSFPSFVNQPKTMTQEFNNSEKIINKTLEAAEKETNPEEGAPSDWLKPKIFKGGGLI